MFKVYNKNTRTTSWRLYFVMFLMLTLKLWTYFTHFSSASVVLLLTLNKWMLAGKRRSHWWGGRGVARGPCTLPPLQLPNQTRSNNFSFRHQGYCYMSIQKWSGLEISQCYLQFLDHSRRLFIFSDYIRRIDHFTLDILKSSDT